MDILKKYSLLLFLVFISLPCFATTYWISPTGEAANLAACDGETPLSGTDACSYDKANGAGVIAGDTVYYRSGAYNITSTAIDPYNTGTDGNVITFSSYNSEDVQFNWVAESGSSSYAIDLNSDSGTVRSYIKINDIHFNSFPGHLWILKGDHNEISYCSFIGYPSYFTQANFAGVFQATYIYRNAQYNWIHNNIFGQWGYNATYGYDTGGVFGLGLEASLTDKTMYNLVENNEMYSGGHHVAYFMGAFNVYRNNYIHNEPWYPLDEPVFATRVVAQQGFGEVDGVYNLNEGNRIGYGGPKNKSEVGGMTTQLTGGYNIWRYNIWAQSYLAALLIKNYSTDAQTTTQYNKIYNNIFWKGGYGNYQDYYDPAATAPSSSWAKSYHHPINVESSAYYTHDNTIKNNIFYQNNTNGTYSIGSYYDFVQPSDNYIEVTDQDISNNWLDSSGDPLFTSISDSADPDIDPIIQWDFSLQSESTAIDAGTYLTLANGSGTNSTLLKVDDSSYFFDATEIEVGIPSATIDSDTIAIGSIDNTVKISKIYKLLTLGIAPSGTWETSDTIHGNTSGIECTIVEKLTDITYIVDNCTDTQFTPGEVLTNGESTSDNDQYIMGYLHNHYAPNGCTWSVGDTLTGQISGATVIITETMGTLSYRYRNRNGNFSTAESITNGTCAAANTGSTWEPAYHDIGKYPILTRSNSIVLSEAKTWLDNAEISLYKKSDGTQVLYGSAPDQGAFENNGVDETPPTISSAAVNISTVTITWNETVVTTAYNADLNMDCSTAGANIALSSPTGTGATRTLTAASPVAFGDTCNIDVVDTNITDASETPNAIETVNDVAVTNNTADVAKQTGRNGINVNGTRNAVTIPGSTPGRMGVTIH
jgi:hypothetical protein